MYNYKNVIKACLVSLVSIQSAFAVEDPQNTEDWLRAAQNPLIPVLSVPMNYTLHGGADNGDVSIGSLQPIFPISLGDWNMINQLSLNIIGTPGVVEGIAELPEPDPGSGVAGLGDTNFTSLFSPANSGIFNWGIGPTFAFPTDTLFSSIEDRRSRQLGSGKFSVGPAAMIVYQPGPWTMGFKTKQIWSVLGADSRESVSQLILEPFANYNLGQGWYLTTNMDTIANWNSHSDNRWTVPVGGGMGKLFNLDSFAINTKLEGYYNVVRPDAAPDWSMNFTLQFMLPK
ncbi:hypothetical protein [Methyloglobulus sp.]|uniref:hypothetical protein n=1 Tax=Methyloglobulus sp. TaxID=2518622 RepID=UPI00398A2D4D